MFILIPNMDQRLHIGVKLAEILTLIISLFFVPKTILICLEKAEIVVGFVENFYTIFFIQKP